MLTATCNACHKPKNDLRAILCPSCETVRNEAMQHFAAEHPNAANSDILYAGRQALSHVSHHAHINFVDPRAHAANRGTIPVPPQDGK